MNGTCTNCGGPARSNARFCKRRECRRAYDRVRRQRIGWALAPELRTRRVRGTCPHCGGPMAKRGDAMFCMSQPCRAAYTREYVKRYKARTGHRPGSAVAMERARQHATLKRRLRGVGPPGRGEKHPRWAGGRVVFCGVCGVECGWRTPRDLKRSKQHFCVKHNGPRPNGRHVTCAKCSRPAGYRSLCELKRNTRFYCQAHKRGRRRSPA